MQYIYCIVLLQDPNLKGPTGRTVEFLLPGSVIMCSKFNFVYLRSVTELGKVRNCAFDY